MTRPVASDKDLASRQSRGLERYQIYYGRLQLESCRLEPRRAKVMWETRVTQHMGQDYSMSIGQSGLIRVVETHRANQPTYSEHSTTLSTMECLMHHCHRPVKPRYESFC